MIKRAIVWLLALFTVINDPKVTTQRFTVSNEFVSMIVQASNCTDKILVWEKSFGLTNSIWFPITQFVFMGGTTNIAVDEKVRSNIQFYRVRVINEN